MRYRGDRPARLIDPGTDVAGVNRILSREECERIVQRVLRFAKGGGETRVRILSWWNGELRWARNRVSLASDRRDIRMEVWRTVGVGRGNVSTNQLDDASLEATVRAAERAAVFSPQILRSPPGMPAAPHAERPATQIWSDSTYAVTPEARREVGRALVAPAEAKGMLSAGYLEMRAGSLISVSSERLAASDAPWDIPYARWTQAQCSMTVRDARGTGSGWAGLSGHDWAKIDSATLAARALEKCEASRNPVALEPGRYTVILEPQAVAELLEVVARSMYREIPEGDGSGPWALAQDDALKLWRTKLGIKVIDERITISHDPADPELGILPQPWMQPVTWFEKGVLTSLVYQRDYALEKLNVNAALRGMTGYRMTGGTTSIDEMIATTRRGLLVTRFSNVHTLDGDTLLATGLTRDGLWLIENGKISKAVKNFRFTESPLFVLNAIEQLGVPVPVFRPVKNPYEQDNPLTPAIVPPLKARDFSFTSTIDAI
ncbi:MAG TPA: metallopeptidase TldD-related protein [Gemmatimonadaceae bacterium]|nr:metallopeptidase TldD-related protein [Gemmatimonadaceae bacterium]